MKRVLLVLTVTAMVLAVMLSSLALPALAQDDRPPADPDCDWYGPFSVEVWEQVPWLEEEAWWEYWCYWPHWGWEFVFWVWADLPEEERDSRPPDWWRWAPEDRYPPLEDENEDENAFPEPEWPPEDWPWSREQ
jgi:hypothetical protein